MHKEQMSLTEGSSVHHHNNCTANAIAEIQRIHMDPTGDYRARSDGHLNATVSRPPAPAADCMTYRTDCHSKTSVYGSSAGLWLFLGGVGFLPHQVCSSLLIERARVSVRTRSTIRLATSTPTWHRWNAISTTSSASSAPTRMPNCLSPIRPRACASSGRSSSSTQTPASCPIGLPISMPSNVVSDALARTIRPSAARSAIPSCECAKASSTPLMD